MRPRTTTSLVIAALMAVSVTACNHTQVSGTEALDAPQSAAAPTPSPDPSAPPASPSAVGTATPATVGPQPPRNAMGVDAFAKAVKHTISTYRSAHIAMRMTGATANLTAKGDVRYTAHGPLMKMRMHMPTLGVKAVQVRMVHGIMYLAMPPLTPRGMFVAIDPSDPNSPLGGSLAGVSKLDPMGSFRAVEAGVRKVTYLGTQRVQGEPMRRYRISVNTRAAAKATGQQLPQGMPRTVRYDVFLDGQDRMRRMRMSELGVTTVITVSRWGVPVHVRAPAKSRLMSLPGSSS